MAHSLHVYASTALCAYGFPCTPSAASFLIVRSRWYSITLRFLKYVTCKIAISLIISRNVHILHTQLLAHVFSNCASSGAQCSLAFLSSLMLSIMPFFSRHSKNASLPSQHCARADLSGAMYPPSFDGSGAGGVVCLEELENKPIAGGASQKVLRGSQGGPGPGAVGEVVTMRCRAASDTCGSGIVGYDGAERPEVCACNVDALNVSVEIGDGMWDVRL